MSDLFDKISIAENHRLKKMNQAERGNFMLGKGLHPFGYGINHDDKCENCIFFSRKGRDITRFCGLAKQKLRSEWPACSAFRKL